MSKLPLNNHLFCLFFYGLIENFKKMMIRITEKQRQEIKSRDLLLAMTGVKAELSQVSTAAFQLHMTGFTEIQSPLKISWLCLDFA